MVSERGRRVALATRWSLRDLRQRWVLVGAIALLIALGTGLFTGLGSMEAWRVASNDVSFALLRVHDLRVELPEGAYLERGRLEAAVAGTSVGGEVAALEERLIVPTQIGVATGDGDVLVPGKIVGSGDVVGELTVDAIDASAGRLPGPEDAASGRVMLESGFAQEMGLPAGGPVQVGARTVEYVGHARTPEQFYLTEGEGGFVLPGGFAFVYAPLDVAGDLAGRPGQVNDLVLRLAPGADRDLAAVELERGLRAALPEVGTTVTTTEEIGAHRILYRDAQGDQELMNVFAALVLAGAALAAFNLVSRIVDSQRREIGIGRALGASTLRVAVRPMLLGLEIAILGVVLGVITGLVIQALLADVLADALPALPVIETPFQVSVFVRGALVGLAVIVLATLFPVWRGVRVPPIKAIRTTALSATRAGAVTLAKRLRLPGGSIAQMPVRSVLRAPRRALVTALGLGAVIAVVVAMLGTLDAFTDMIDRSERETVAGAPTRVIATLDTVVAADGAPVRAIDSSRVVSEAEPWLRVPAAVARSAGAEPIELLLGIPESDTGIWRPNASSGSLDAGSQGILISEVAADDLGVGVGDEVMLTYPRPGAGGAIALAGSPVEVAGTHADPFRALAYMDSAGASRLGLAGLANSVDVLPAPGARPDDVARALVGIPGVATVEPASASTTALREAIDEYQAILLIPIGVGVVLALLIAFNSSTIGADERTRENATMFAFGLRPRTPIAIAMQESLIVGVVGTAIGVGLGMLLLAWIVHVQFPDVLPEVGARVVLSGGTLLQAALAGVVAVTLAPLLTLPRIRRMDVPASLRVME